MSLAHPYNAGLGFGVGLRTVHFDRILGERPQVDWFEIISENFMIPGGRPLWVLDRVRENYPIVMHGVSLSIGSADPLSGHYLDELRRLIDRVQPEWISDHLCWTSIGGHNSHDLLPLPYTEEALDHIVERVKRVQDQLGRQILLENPSTYLEFSASTIPEPEFLREIAQRADCFILLDVNNVFVSAFNHRFSAEAYIDSVPVDRVRQFHLAGHSDRGTFLHDTHDHAVPDSVWALYRRAVRRFGEVPTLIEWDDNIPPFEELQAEARRARQHASMARTAADDSLALAQTA